MAFLDYLNPLKKFEFLKGAAPSIPGMGGGMSIPGMGSGGGFDIGSLFSGMGGGGGMSLPGVGAGAGGGMFDIGSMIPGMGGSGMGGGGMSLPGMGGSGGAGGIGGLGGLGGGGGAGDLGGGGLPGAGLLGGLTGSEAVYGKKPEAVKFPSPGELLGENTNANLSNVPGFLDLSKQLMEGQQPILLDALERSAPGTGEAQKGFMDNILAGIKGDMSPAQLSSIQNAGAAWGINSGTGGGGIGNARDLRNVGQEASKRQDIAGSQLMNFVENQRRFSMPQLIDAGQNMLKPSYDPYGQFNYANYRANVDAAPIPSAAGQAAAETALMESVLGAYAGTPHSAGAQYGNQIGGGYAGASVMPVGTTSGYNAAGYPVSQAPSPWGGADAWGY